MRRRGGAAQGCNVVRKGRETRGGGEDWQTWCDSEKTGSKWKAERQMRKRRTVGNVLTRGIFSSYRRKQLFGSAGAVLHFSENIPQTEVID